MDEERTWSDAREMFRLNKIALERTLYRIQSGDGTYGVLTDERYFALATQLATAALNMKNAAFCELHRGGNVIQMVIEPSEPI